MRRPRFFQPLLLAGIGLTAARVAHAQNNPAAAEALFEQARAAMAAGSYNIACARFRDSDKLDPAVGTRFNLADCEEKRGHVATAWSLFRGVLSELAPDDDRRPIAEKRAKALEPRLPYLTLLRTERSPPGARLRVDGVELGEGSLGVALPMDPGAHELELLLAGEENAQKSQFTLREGERKELPIGVVKEPIDASRTGAAGAPADASTAAPEAGGDRRWKRSWGYAALSVGAAGAVFGTVSGVLTLHEKAVANGNCDDAKQLCNQVGHDANDSGRTFGTLSVIGLGVGVAGLATGAYLLFTAPPAAHSSIPSARKLAVNPELSLTSGTGFLSVEGSF